MFACMQAAFIYTGIGVDLVCIHFFIFFFDNVSHEGERVSCVCVVTLMLCPTIKSILLMLYSTSAEGL